METQRFIVHLSNTAWMFLNVIDMRVEFIETQTAIGNNLYDILEISQDPGSYIATHDEIHQFIGYVPELIREIDSELSTFDYNSRPGKREEDLEIFYKLAKIHSMVSIWLDYDDISPSTPIH